jgi:hypothetical protein
MPTPLYSTVVSAHLTRSGGDADATPALAEVKCDMTTNIFGAPPSTSSQTKTVSANTPIEGEGLLLNSINRRTWFYPALFRCRVVEVDAIPLGPDLAILDFAVNFGTAADWADGNLHTVNVNVQNYAVTLKYQVTKVQ